MRTKLIICLIVTFLIGGGAFVTSEALTKSDLNKATAQVKKDSNKKQINKEKKQVKKMKKNKIKNRLDST